MAKRRNNTPMKVRARAGVRRVWHGRARSPHTLNPRTAHAPILHIHIILAPQRFQHLVATTYAYVRPAAYYGFIPFVLYVGMNGDAAPR